MKVSHRWLKEFVPFQFSPQQLAEKLSMLGLEVESYEDQSEEYRNFVVGEVLETQKHPNADRLTVCKVNVGTEILQIVCGAPNVAAGQKVPVALIGAIIKKNQHNPDGKPFTIQQVKIRGVESYGMICSEYELGIGNDQSGILILKSNTKAGTPLAKYFNRTDIIYEIGITPNRGDCLSHIGIAREISALVQKEIRLKPIQIKESKIPTSSAATVKISDSQRCPRYCARVVRNVKIAPSPQWLQQTLSSLGIRPINNVVDITNYVLLETGHPLHAFDYDKLAGHTIIVRTANDGEKFITLDGKERVLTSDTLVICDAERPVAIAGVMGGANTEISDTTVNVLIESAYFDPSCIRRTSKYLGLSTESSYRFERNADIDMIVYAINRAAQLMAELAGGEVLKGLIDIYPKKKKQTTVSVRIQRVNDIIGISLTKAQIISLLKRLHLRVQSKSKDIILVTVPHFRNDLKEEIDIIEEVARLYGYNNIETKTRSTIDFGATIKTDDYEEELRYYLCGSGFNEILTISMLDAATARLAGGEPIKVLNAVSAGMEVLRTSLIPGSLRVALHNLNRGIKDLRLFEIGTVFNRNLEKPDNELDAYNEHQHLLILLSGNKLPLSYRTKPQEVDFFDLKGEVEGLFRKLKLDKYRFIYYDTHSPILTDCVGVQIGDTKIGFFGKVKDDICKYLEVDQAVYVCEIDIDQLRSHRVRDIKFEQLPKYPAVRRDVAFIIDNTVTHQEVEKVINNAGAPLLKKVILFDLYTGGQVGAGKRSVAYSLEFQTYDHTLTDAEVDVTIEAIIQAVQNQCRGVLRK